MCTRTSRNSFRGFGEPLKSSHRSREKVLSFDCPRSGIILERLEATLASGHPAGPSVKEPDSQCGGPLWASSLGDFLNPRSWTQAIGPFLSSSSTGEPQWAQQFFFPISHPSHLCMYTHTHTHGFISIFHYKAQSCRTHECEHKKGWNTVISSFRDNHCILFFIHVCTYKNLIFNSFSEA